MTSAGTAMMAAKTCRLIVPPKSQWRTLCASEN
jgi:hypothetical protein